MAYGDYDDDYEDLTDKQFEELYGYQRAPFFENPFGIFSGEPLGRLGDLAGFLDIIGIRASEMSRGSYEDQDGDGIADDIYSGQGALSASPVSIVQRNEAGEQIGIVQGVRIGFGDNARVVTLDELASINEARKRAGQDEITPSTPGFVPQVVDPSGSQSTQSGAPTVEDPTYEDVYGNNADVVGNDPVGGGDVTQTNRASSVSDFPDASQGVEIREGGSGGGIARYVVVGGVELPIPEWVGNIGGYLRSLGATAGVVSAVQEIETKKETDREAEVKQAREKEIAEIRDSKIKELEEEIDGLRQEDITELNEEKKERLGKLDTEIKKLRKEKIDSLEKDIARRKKEELADLEV